MSFLTEQLEATKKFEEDHGGRPVLDLASGRQIYPDGTERKFNDVLNMFEFYQPTEPGEQLRAKRKYVALLLKVEQRDFIAFKKDCIEAAQRTNVQPPRAHQTASTSGSAQAACRSASRSASVPDRYSYRPLACSPSLIVKLATCLTKWLNVNTSMSNGSERRHVVSKH